ncbi:MAG: hypothetical protein GWP61_04620 [Chloroflexi bacterium]|nr:hypothetical protein [Chloroflexota bacterium]
MLLDTIACFGGFDFPIGDPTIPAHPSDVRTSRGGANQEQVSAAPCSAESSVDVMYDFDSLFAKGGPGGMGASIFTFGGDREASFIAPNPLLVYNDIWRFSPPDASKESYGQSAPTLIVGIFLVSDLQIAYR